MATDIYPPEFDTPLGQVRSLIPDVEILEDPTDLSLPGTYLFSDDHLKAFLSIYNDNIKRAAAAALNTLATTEALILKVLRSDDRQTDGAKLADSLGRRAAFLKAEADRDDEEDAYEAFDIIPYRPVPISWEIR